MVCCAFHALGEGTETWPQEPWTRMTPSEVAEARSAFGFAKPTPLCECCRAAEENATSRVGAEKVGP